MTRASSFLCLRVDINFVSERYFYLNTVMIRLKTVCIACRQHLQSVLCVPSCEKITTCFFTQSSASEEEIEKFSKLAPRWWDKNGETRALHSMNRIRVPFIRDNLLLQALGVSHSSKPLLGISIFHNFGCWVWGWDIVGRTCTSGCDCGWG